MLHTYIRKQWNSQNASTLPMLEHSLGIMHECCSQMLPYLLLCAPREILTLKKSQNKLGSEDALVIFSSHQIFMLAPSTWKWSQRSAALAAEKLKNPGHDPGTLLLQMLTYSVKKIILSCDLIAGTRNITLMALMTAWPLTVWQDPSIKIYSQLHWWWPHQTVQLFLAHYKYEVVKKDASEGPKISPIKLYL